MWGWFSAKMLSFHRNCTAASKRWSADVCSKHFVKTPIKSFLSIFASTRTSSAKFRSTLKATKITFISLKSPNLFQAFLNINKLINCTCTRKHLILFTHSKFPFFSLSFIWHRVQLIFPLVPASKFILHKLKSQRADLLLIGVLWCWHYSNWAKFRQKQ